MTIEPPITDPAAVLQACFDDLTANRTPETILRRLRAIESLIKEPALRAELLHVRAIATVRLGFSTESLGDLQEAVRILEHTNNSADRSQIFRTIALVHSWRGDCLESAMALLRSVAEANAAQNSGQLILALIEGARLHIEMGRTRDAQALLSSALCSADVGVPILERQRAWVNLLQVRVASGQLIAARTQLGDLSIILDESPSRLRMLALIEWARILRLSNELEKAEDVLQQASDLAPQELDSFEQIEIAHARAELLLSQGDLSAAASQVEKVVTRYATDDLAGREVVARFLQAQIFDGLGRAEQAERTLAAALRRALARGLSGYVDEARSRIAARGAAQGVWRVGEAPSVTPATKREARLAKS